MVGLSSASACGLVFYPGLDELIKSSKYIVVAVIEREPDKIDRCLGRVYAIHSVSLLKGDVTPGESVKAYLSESSFATRPYDILLGPSFKMGNKFVLFLNDRDFEVGVKDLPSDVRFKDPRTEGDAFWLPFRIALPLRMGKDPRKDIELLLGARLKYEKERLKYLDSDADDYLHMSGAERIKRLTVPARKTTSP